MTHVLYAARGDILDDLYTIDPATGAETSVGPIGFIVAALAPNDADTLWGLTTAFDDSPNSLISIDRATGAGTLIGDTGILPNDDGQSNRGFQDAVGLGDRLFVTYSTSSGPSLNALASIDTVTGAGTQIATFPVNNGAAISPRPTDFWNAAYLQAFAIAGTLYQLALDGTLTPRGDFTDWPPDAAHYNEAFAFAVDPADLATVYALVMDSDDSLPATVNLATIDVTDPDNPVTTLVGPMLTGLRAMTWETGPVPPTVPLTWTNEGPAGELIVYVASGLNPDSFTEARRFGPGERRGRFDPLVIDGAAQSQAFSVRVQQEGQSASTEIYSIDVDLRPQPSALEGENS